MKVLENKYKDIMCFEFEESDEKLSVLPIGSTLAIMSVPDIDDEIWPAAYVDRKEKNMWVLTDVTCKYMEDSEIPKSILVKMSLEMNSSEDYEIVINNTNYQIVIRQDTDFKSVYDLWKRVRNDFFEYYNAIINQKKHRFDEAMLF